MGRKKKVVFFCSASYDIDIKYNQAARKIVRAACLQGYEIVSGGAIKGTMGAVADEVAVCGGIQIGIIPRFMRQYKHPALDDVIWTDTMAERKEAMRFDTDIAVALPGGVGTLDELIETYELAKLDKYHGKILVFNLDGFYEPLKILLDHYVKTGMMTQRERALIEFPDSVEEVIGYFD